MLNEIITADIAFVDARLADVRARFDRHAPTLGSGTRDAFLAEIRALEILRAIYVAGLNPHLR